MSYTLRIYSTSLSVDMLEHIYSRRLIALMRCYLDILEDIEVVDLALSLPYNLIQYSKPAHSTFEIDGRAPTRVALAAKGHLKKDENGISLPQAVLLRGEQAPMWLGSFPLCQYLVDAGSMRDVLQGRKEWLGAFSGKQGWLQIISQALGTEKLVILADQTSYFSEEDFSILERVIGMFGEASPVLDWRNPESEEQSKLVAEAEAYVAKKDEKLGKVAIWVEGRALSQSKVAKLLRAGLLGRIKEKL